MAKEWFGTTPTDRARDIVNACCHSAQINLPTSVRRIFATAFDSVIRATEAEVRAECAKIADSVAVEASDNCCDVTAQDIATAIREAKP